MRFMPTGVCRIPHFFTACYENIPILGMILSKAPIRALIFNLKLFFDLF